MPGLDRTGWRRYPSFLALLPPSPPPPEGEPLIAIGEGCLQEPGLRVGSASPIAMGEGLG